jgi:hypothetical protein
VVDEDGIQPEHAAILIAAKRMKDRGSLEDRYDHNREEQLAPVRVVGAETGRRHSGDVGMPIQDSGEGRQHTYASPATMRARAIIAA